MPEEVVAAEKKPVRKRRKKQAMMPLKIFSGSANYHVCRISTREDMEVTGFQEKMVQLSSELMRNLLQRFVDKGFDPADLHIAFELTLDTEDHPGEKGEPAMPERVM